MSLFKKLLFAALALLLMVILTVTIITYKLTHRSEGQYFESDGLRLFYFEAGNPDGPPVVLLHGFASQSDRGWRLTGTIDALEDDYRLILLDSRGCGLSDKPYDVEAYGINMVHDVAALLDHLDLQQANIAGYSLGGFVSLKFAQLYPEKCLTISVMGAGWENPDNSKALEALDSVATLLREGKPVGPLGALIDKNRPPPTFLHKFMVNLTTGYLNDTKALAATVEAVPGLAVTAEQVGQINIPLCSIVGEKDVFITAAKRLCKMAPDCTQTIVPDAGHVKAAASDLKSEQMKAFLDEHNF